MDASTLEAAGWQSLSPEGHTGLIGPFWLKGKGKDRQVGLIAEARHCNNHIGSVHGGVLMTLSDVGMGLGVVDELGGLNCLTAELQIQFVATAKLGEFLVCKPELVRNAKSMLFMRGLIMVEGRIIASISGIWKALELSSR
jgi:uncharacterized protein (TIGR00369 family)